MVKAPNSVMIPFATVEKYLGITLDKKFNWNSTAKVSF